MKALLTCAIVITSIITEAVFQQGNAGIARAGEEKCPVSRVGLDSTHGNFYTASYFGKSATQVFYAPDSVVTAITFWRGPDPTPNIIDMRLYVMGMDSEHPLQPDPLNLILEGPTVILLGQSDMPRPVRFELDPPLQLPAVGRFAFALKPGTDCSGGFSVMIDSTGSYAEGDAWHITPNFDCEGLGSFQRTSSGDLIFEIEMCETPVPAKRTSWGSLKGTYR
jgi:hypothetical protein